MAQPQLRGRIGIDGEREFKEALRGAGNSVKLLDSQMQLLKAEFKDGEKTLEHYQREQELLTAKISEQKKQVATMEDVLAAVKGKFGENSDQAARYATMLNKTKAALAETEGQLRKCTTEMDALEKSMEEGAKATKKQGDAAEDAEKKHSKLRSAADASGAVMKGAVVAGATAAAAALAAVGAAAVKATADLTNMGTGYQAANNLLSAQTGATGEALQELSDIAQSIYLNKFGENIGEVNEALATTRTNTGLVGEELQAATEAGFLLKDTFGFEFQESSKTARSLMKNFGVSAQEAYNLMALGAQNGANQNGDMLDVLAEYGPMYASMGMSADQMINSLIAGNEAGVFSIDKVGDAMKEFSIRCVDGSATTHEAMAAIGLDAGAMAQQFAMGGENARFAFQTAVEAIMAIEDPVKRSQTAVQLFGTQFEDLGPEILPILAEMATSGDSTANALGQIAAVRYDDLNNSIEGFSRKVQAELAPVAQQFSALAKQAVDDASAVLTDGFQPEDAKVIGESLASALVEGIATIQGLMESAQPIFQSTVSAIGEAIGGLLPTMIGTLLPAATGLLQSLVDSVTTNVEPLTRLATDIVTSISSFLVENAGGLAGSAKNLIEGLVGGIADALPDLLPAAASIVGEILKALSEIDWIQMGLDLLQGLVNGLTSAVATLWESIKAVFIDIWSGIKSVFGINSPSTVAAEAGGFILQGLLEGFQAAVDGVVTQVKKIFGKIWDAIKSIFGFGGQSEESKEAKAAGQDIMTGMQEGITGNEDELKETVQDIAKTVLSTFNKEFGTQNGSSTKTKPMGENLVRGLIDGLEAKKSNLESAASGLATAASNALWGAVGTNGSKFNAIGSAISTGIASGISSGSGKISAAAKAAAQAAYDAACDELEIRSPSRKGRYIGSNYVQSVAMGMDESRKQVTAAAATMARAANSTTQQTLQVQAAAIDYDRLGKSVARANREAGLGNAVVKMDRYVVGWMVEPTVMRVGQTRSQQTVSGRGARMMKV